MNTPFESFELDEGTDAYGVHTSVVFEGDQAIKRQSYDAQPIIEQCKAERIQTEGHRWGEMRKVGTIPMAEYQLLLKEKDVKKRQALCLQFLKARPALVSFDKFLK